jgi:hypothetical protein
VPLTSHTIFTDPVAPATLTRCTPFTVTYSITGTYNAGNVFTAELSDPTGSFSVTTTIGTVTATVAVPITATIPGPAAAGTLYRIRVISSNPAVTGSDNGANLTLAGDGGAGTWTWQGTAGANWFDRCNWDMKTLPSATSDVVIPPTGNNPVISGAAAACRKVTVNSAAGARLYVNTTGGGTLTVTQ